MKTSKNKKVLHTFLAKFLSCRPCMALFMVACIFCIFLFYTYYFSAYEVVRDPSLLDAAYKNEGLTTEERVNDLLSRMTLQEKIGQMALIEKNSIDSLDDIPRYGIGALLSGAGARPYNNTLQGWREMVGGYTDASLRSRLQIPILYGVDAIHGHSNIPEATIFPHFIGLGASGDPDLVEEIAQITAQELLATGIRWSFSPTLDMPTDIRWGRTYEAFSDDPEVVGVLGAAYLRGLQNETASGISVLGTPKHYIGAGGMLWESSSNQNYKIDQGRTPADENQLREVYLPPFKEMTDHGAMSIMVGLNSWDDTKLSAHEYLVTQVLKEELGFDGFVVSDWYGVYEIDEDTYVSTVAAINAGIDMVMLPYDYKTFIQNVEEAVRKGDITEARIDDAVRRILVSKFMLGLFDEPTTLFVTDSLFGGTEHRILAREAVQKSLVLLKNSGVLPIKGDVRHIRIAGSAADNVGRQSGAWTVEWQGAEGNFLPGATSILKGIEERVSDDVLLEYDRDAHFTTKSIADVGIAILGEAPYAEGWGDSENLNLSREDLEVIAQLKENSMEVVVILVSGRPLLITEELVTWDALIAAWLPGSEGAGVADALFGDVSFTGRLPLPWPRHIEQLPFSADGTSGDGTLPLFPRNYGL